MNSIADNSEDAAEDSMTGMNALTQRHEELRAKNALKVGILMAYLTDKLENIGEGKLWVGGYFPEEKMWEDLALFTADQISEIQALADWYYDIIVAKLN